MSSETIQQQIEPQQFQVPVKGKPVILLCDRCESIEHIEFSCRECGQELCNLCVEKTEEKSYVCEDCNEFYEDIFEEFILPSCPDNYEQYLSENSEQIKDTMKKHMIHEIDVKISKLEDKLDNLKQKNNKKQ